MNDDRMGDDEDRPRSSFRVDVSRYAAISQFTSEVVGCVLLGLGADYYWSIQPWGVIAGAVLGFTVALYHLIKNVQPPRGQ